jgi:hypothetical protein
LSAAEQNARQRAYCLIGDLKTLDLRSP